MAVPVSPTLTVRLLVVAPARVNVYCPGFGVVPSRVSAASASAAARSASVHQCFFFEECIPFAE